jgi:hypothetical protein
MKKRIFALMAALVLVGFLTEVAPCLLKNTNLAWINGDSLFGRHGFYFKKRQWLADIRTIIAAFRYLCVSHAATPDGLTSGDGSLQSVSPGAELQTNLVGMKGVEVCPPLAGKCFWRKGRIMALYYWPAGTGAMTCLVACNESLPNGLGGLRVSRLGYTTCVPESRGCLLLRVPQRALTPPPKAPKSQSDVTVTNLEGA